MRRAKQVTLSHLVMDPPERAVYWYWRLDHRREKEAEESVFRRVVGRVGVGRVPVTNLPLLIKLRLEGVSICCG